MTRRYRGASVLLASVLFGVFVYADRLVAQRGGGAGTIAGRVLDPSGQPVTDAFVTLVRRTEGNSGSRIAPVSAALGTRSNSAGQYALTGLNDGQYYVVVFPRNVQLLGPNQPNRAGFGITYFPSALSPLFAQEVVVSAATPATADVTLAPVRLFVVAGRVLKADGEPATGMLLHIAHGDGLFGLAGTQTSIGPDGRFAIAGVPPGTYHLHMREGAWPPPLDVIPKVSGAKVPVGGNDAGNVQVLPIEMVVGRGRIVRGSETAAAPGLSGVTIAATPLDFDGNPGPTRPGQVKDDLTFEFRAWPGLNVVRVSPREWVVKSVRLKGRDVTQGLEFRQGAPIEDLEVELARSTPATR